ncbi:hypothetical protein [Rhodococcoides fascians]|uniref:hypothetical protein n=1 Tax=Rhodococcoides fascians TaxID=1828 RepID=UPI00055A1646|nr:hypothetical protein [Rhodococcus fascians]
MTALDTAAAALERAAVLDHRLTVTEATVQAWADCFTDKPIWLDEAVKAVGDHYSQPSPFPIMPGDVLARVADIELGPKSSQERIDWFLDTWAQHPYARALMEATGVEFKLPPEPDEFRTNSWGAHNWHRDWLIGWVNENREKLVAAIRSGQSRYRGPRHEGW